MKVLPFHGSNLYITYLYSVLYKTFEEVQYEKKNRSKPACHVHGDRYVHGMRIAAASAGERTDS